MHKISGSAVLCLLGGTALAIVTLVGFRLHFNLATAVLLFLIVVVLCSLKGSFVAAAVVSVMALGFLDYFFVPPIFSFRVGDPLNLVAILAFSTTSWIITRLVCKVRVMADEALSSVSHKVIEAEEQQRQRIARDLHEGIGQRLALLTIEIERLDPDSPASDLAGHINAVREQSLDILTDVKGLAHELYSPRLEYLGILAVMKSFCEDFRQQKGVEIDFVSEGLPTPVSPDISLCLFRVLQEALHNAVQHSGVKRFVVQLHGTPLEIRLVVSDAGSGFNLEAARKAHGLGLNHMQERLKLVKGSLSIESRPKHGTTIHASVPLSSLP